MNGTAGSKTKVVCTLSGVTQLNLTAGYGEMCVNCNCTPSTHPTLTLSHVMFTHVYSAYSVHELMSWAMMCMLRSGGASGWRRQGVHWSSPALSDVVVHVVRQKVETIGSWKPRAYRPRGLVTIVIGPDRTGFVVILLGLRDWEQDLKVESWKLLSINDIWFDSL